MFCPPFGGYFCGTIRTSLLFGKTSSFLYFSPSPVSDQEEKLYLWEQVGKWEALSLNINGPSGQDLEDYMNQNRLPILGIRVGAEMVKK